jgi:hypothetical protein
MAVAQLLFAMHIDHSTDAAFLFHPCRDSSESSSEALVQVEHQVHVVINEEQ